MPLPEGITDVYYQEGDEFQTEADAMVSAHIDAIGASFPGSTVTVILSGPGIEPGTPRAHLFASTAEDPLAAVHEALDTLFGDETMPAAWVKEVQG